MKDSMKSCQHKVADDVEYKEVVIIGNGPSGMVTSFMLAGNVPYLKDIPGDLPIDEMLRARLTNLPRGQSLYETDLLELAEGLEGRSQNPIPLLMDNLLRPCADMGIQADSLIEWRYDVEKQIDHIVLGRGPAGGAWHTFPAGVRTLSPGAWLALPPHAHAALGPARLPARAVAAYCRRYVHACKIQKYFRTGVTVTSVTSLPQSTSRCHNPKCPLNAAFCVTGFEACTGRQFRYVCARAVLASGGAGAPNTLRHAAPHALHSLAQLERAVQLVSTHKSSTPPAVLVVGSGLSGADAVWLSVRAGLNTFHLHRTPADALARLSPQVYPDYYQVYKMMCDGPSANHHNYTPFPEHTILDVIPEGHNKLDPEDENYAFSLKKVKLLNMKTKEITEIKVNIIGVFIGSKPDLFFLQTNFLDCLNIKIDCDKCIDDSNVCKRKIEEKQCFLKNHWLFIKSILGQSIQSCKSRYLNYSEFNGNSENKYVIPDCNRLNDKSDTNKIDKWIIPYNEEGNGKHKCSCDTLNPYSSGLGFGLDPEKPVDGRNNPIAIDKSSHEILNAPKGMYALGPLTADNFMRFIPGGALAIVSHIHKNK